VIGFPLLLIPLSIYIMIAFLTPGVSWTGPVYSVPVPLKSGDLWSPTAGDALITFALLMLMFEFIKATRQGKSLVEHFLALLLAGGATAAFVMVHEAATSTFFLLVVICFVDLFAGFAASLRRARRAVVVAPVPVPVEPRRVEPVRAEPVRAEPARTDPFAPPPMPRAEPVVKIEPVQKSET
jgi:hypothetical protein